MPEEHSEAPTSPVHENPASGHLASVNEEDESNQSIQMRSVAPSYQIGSLARSQSIRQMKARLGQALEGGQMTRSQSMMQPPPAPRAPPPVPVGPSPLTQLSASHSSPMVPGPIPQQPVSAPPQPIGESPVLTRTSSMSRHGEIARTPSASREHRLPAHDLAFDDGLGPSLTTMLSDYFDVNSVSEKRAPLTQPAPRASGHPRPVRVDVTPARRPRWSMASDHDTVDSHIFDPNAVPWLAHMSQVGHYDRSEIHGGGEDSDSADGHTALTQLSEETPYASIANTPTRTGVLDRPRYRVQRPKEMGGVEISYGHLPASQPSRQPSFRSVSASAVPSVPPVPKVPTAYTQGAPTNAQAPLAAPVALRSSRDSMMRASQMFSLDFDFDDARASRSLADTLNLEAFAPKHEPKPEASLAPPAQVLAPPLTPPAQPDVAYLQPSPAKSPATPQHGHAISVDAYSPSPRRPWGPPVQASPAGHLAIAHEGLAPALSSGDLHKFPGSDGTPQALSSDVHGGTPAMHASSQYMPSSMPSGYERSVGAQLAPVAAPPAPEPAPILEPAPPLVPARLPGPQGPVPASPAAHVHEPAGHVPMPPPQTGPSWTHGRRQVDLAPPMSIAPPAHAPANAPVHGPPMGQIPMSHAPMGHAPMGHAHTAGPVRVGSPPFQAPYHSIPQSTSYASLPGRHASMPHAASVPAFAAMHPGIPRAPSAAALHPQQPHFASQGYVPQDMSSGMYPSRATSPALMPPRAMSPPGVLGYGRSPSRGPISPIMSPGISPGISPVASPAGPRSPVSFEPPRAQLVMSPAERERERNAHSADQHLARLGIPRTSSRPTSPLGMADMARSTTSLYSMPTGPRRMRNVSATAIDDDVRSTTSAMRAMSPLGMREPSISASTSALGPTTAAAMRNAPLGASANQVMSMAGTPSGVKSADSVASLQPRAPRRADDVVLGSSTMSTVAIVSGAQPTRGSLSRRMSTDSRRRRASMDAGREGIERTHARVALMTHATPPRKVGSTQVIVQVIATAIDSIDRSIVREKVTSELSYGFVPGRSFCGRIVEMGRGVKRLRMGDTVFGLQLARASGALAEYITIDQDLVVNAPEGRLSAEEIAALPSTGIMVHQIVQNHCATLRKGSRILVLNAHDGVGLLTLQGARRLGLVIVAQVPPGVPDSTAVCRANGANEVVSGEALWAINLLHESSFSLVIDTVGGRAIYDACRRVLANNGEFVTSVGDSGAGTSAYRSHLRSLRRAFVKKDRKSIGYEWVGMDGNIDVRLALEAVRSIAQKGIIRPRIQSVLSLEEAPRVFDADPTGEEPGIAVIRIS